MEESENRENVYRQLLPLFESEWLKKCTFGDEFRNEWKRVLRNALRNDESYQPETLDAVFSVNHSFEDVNFTFHFDQNRLLGWYQEDCRRKERRVFLTRQLTRSRIDGSVGIQSSKLNYDSTVLEPTVPETGDEIFVCSLPGFPPPLQVIYGNQRVEKNFHGILGRNKLNIQLIRAEFTPAFLCSAFEVCLYLFWMDCCIMMENQPKIKADRLRPLLHIFRRPSMLTLKGLL